MLTCLQPVSCEIMCYEKSDIPIILTGVSQNMLLGPIVEFSSISFAIILGSCPNRLDA